MLSREGHTPAKLARGWGGVGVRCCQNDRELTNISLGAWVKSKRDEMSKFILRRAFAYMRPIFRKRLDGDLLCRGTTRAAYVNAETQRPVRVPDFLC